MGTIAELLDCAEHNATIPGIGAMLAKAQIRQYKELKAAGANDVDESLKKYPECALKFGQ